jgi:hypothetical protein
MVDLCAWINATKTQYDLIVALQQKIDGYDQPLPLAELGFLRGEGQVFYSATAGVAPTMMRASLLDCALLLCTPLKRNRLRLEAIVKVDGCATVAALEQSANGPVVKGANRGKGVDVCRCPCDVCVGAH